MLNHRYQNIKVIKKMLRDHVNTIIKRTREVIIVMQSSNNFRFINRLTDGKEKAAKAKKLLDEIRKKSNAELYRHIMTPEQELVEAICISCNSKN